MSGKLSSLSCPKCDAPVDGPGECPYCGSTIVEEKTETVDSDALADEIVAKLRTAPAAPVRDLAAEKTEEIDGFLRQGKKIAAIKEYRTLHDVGLKEAKEAIEQMIAEDPELQELNSCFPAHARVLTPLGYRVISSLSKGDSVLSISRSGGCVTRRITRVLEHEATPTVEVRFEGEGVSPLEATANHRILTGDGRWTRIDALKAGDKVRSAEGGLQLVAAVVPTLKVEPVYNLYTEGEHNFVVEGVPVHNFTDFPVLRTLLHRALFDSLGNSTGSKHPSRPLVRES